MRTTRISLAVAGLGFAAFPLLRPFGDKTGAATDMAAAFADPLWVLAHCCSMAGFIALALAMRRWGHRRLELSAWLGAVLVLPFYGGETFALHAIGTQALTDGDLGILAAADGFRNHPVALGLFTLGLLGVAVVGVGIAAVTSSDRIATRAAGLLTAVGLVTYLPQFFLPPTGRLVHGLLLGAGLILLAAFLRHSADEPAARPE